MVERHLRQAEPQDEVMRAGAEALAAHIQLEDAGRTKPSRPPAERSVWLSALTWYSRHVGLGGPGGPGLCVARVHDLHAVELALTRRVKVVTKHNLRLGVVRSSRKYAAASVDELRSSGSTDTSRFRVFRRADPTILKPSFRRSKRTTMMEGATPVVRHWSAALNTNDPDAAVPYVRQPVLGRAHRHRPPHR